jgi:hypothetical protein
VIVEDIAEQVIDVGYCSDASRSDMAGMTDHLPLLKGAKIMRDPSLSRDVVKSEEVLMLACLRRRGNIAACLQTYDIMLFKSIWLLRSDIRGPTSSDPVYKQRKGLACQADMK